MLAFGRQPRSPIDMLISTGDIPTKVTGSASQYLETTVKRRQELSEIALENLSEHNRVLRSMIKQENIQDNHGRLGRD